jgi:hypothetical protein
MFIGSIGQSSRIEGFQVSIWVHDLSDLGKTTRQKMRLEVCHSGSFTKKMMNSDQVFFFFFCCKNLVKIKFGLSKFQSFN